MLKNQIIAAAYYFPNYHVDPQNEKIHGTGWTEWELMKCVRPRFLRHRQPRIPLWGYEDEALPEVMEQKIDAASNSGLDAFIFDWYWYEGPFLERALTNGFLKASRGKKFKFALMWANHDWRNFHPAGRMQPYPVNHNWSTTRHTVGMVWDYIIENFMLRDNYWQVNGSPYFSIYAMNRFIKQMGGVEAATEVIALLREKAQRAGLPGVHINAIWMDMLDSSPQCSECPQKDWAEKIGIDSYTTYNNTCIADWWFDKREQVDYAENSAKYLEICRKAQSILPAPYYPVITLGWDSSPRSVQSESWDREPGYPYLPVMDATPELFGEAVKATVENLSSRPSRERIVFFNAWNEWTEGSYLEPDTNYGMSFLETIKKFKGE
jgi:hypothetical protein